MKDLTIRTFENGKWRQNCYIVTDCEGRALIVDPGSEWEGIVALLGELNVIPVGILNTHAHYDHIGAVAALQSHYQIPFTLHEEDAGLLKRANVYKLLFESKSNLIIPRIDETYPNSSAGAWNCGGFTLSVIHTPGHTPGSVCLLLNGSLFSGDTLLPNGPGRVDLPGGDKTALSTSLEKLRSLPDNTMVFPGHGKPFSLQSFFQRHHEN